MFGMTTTDWWQLFDIIARIVIFFGAIESGARGGIVAKVIAMAVILFVTCGGW